MKRISLKFALVFLLCAPLRPVTFEAAAEVARVKLATLAPKGSSFHQALQEMGESWRQASGGGVGLTIFTDGTMGSEADMVRRMRIGQIQAAMLTVVGLAEIDRSVNALQLMPMMFRSWEEVDFVREKLRAQFEQDFLNKGFVVLFWGDAGWVRFFATEPLINPDDLSRHKIFVSSGSTETADILKGMGYRPVPIETTDILPGLQTGLVTAVPTTPVYANAGQFYKQAPHMLDLKWVPVVGGTVISKRVWEKLPAATRDDLMAAAQEAGQKIRKRSRAENLEAIEAMQKRGLQVHSATPEVEAAWRRLADDTYPKIRGKLVPAAMFDQVTQLLQQYRAGANKGQ